MLLNGNDVVLISDSARTKDFVTLLYLVRRHNPEKPIVLVVDNAKIHIAERAIRTAVSLGIRLVFLPPYSPDLNPIEFSWRDCKRDLWLLDMNKARISFKETFMRYVKERKISETMKKKQIIFAGILIILLTVSLIFINNSFEASSPEKEIRELVHILELAVKGQNISIYLMNINLEDIVLREEQKHWFGSLERNPVKEFTLEITNIKVSGGKATANPTMNWLFDDSNSPRSLTCEVNFIKHDGKWFFAGPNFATVSDDKFVIHYFPEHESLAKSLLPKLHKIFDVITADLNFKPSSKNSYQTLSLC